MTAPKAKAKAKIKAKATPRTATGKLKAKPTAKPKAKAKPRATRKPAAPKVVTRPLSQFVKFKKAEAFEAIMRLRQGETLGDTEIDSLIMYFAPPLKARAESPWEWVARAVSTDETRPALCGIYVTKDALIASNGHALHVSTDNTSGVKPGFYDAKTRLPKKLEKKQYMAESILAKLQETRDLRKKQKNHHFMWSTDIAAVKEDSNLEHAFLYKPPVPKGFDPIYLGKQLMDNTINKQVMVSLTAVAPTASGTDPDRVYGSTVFGDFVVMGKRP